MIKKENKLRYSIVTHKDDKRITTIDERSTITSYKEIKMEIRKIELWKNNS